jgi:predicted RNA binding protein YcfA (HicA-like mRNA interferase family)
MILSKWDKLSERIKSLDKSVRFDELSKALTRIGYLSSQPKGGSSHYTFRKSGKGSITIPKSTPAIKVYVEMVRDALIDYESEVDEP